MDCQESRRRLSARLDGELAPEGGPPLAEHLRGCADCARAAKGFASIREAITRTPPPAAPSGTAETVLERIRTEEVRVVRATSLFRRIAAAAAVLLIGTTLTILLTGPGESAGAGDLTADSSIDRIMSEMIRPPLAASEEDDR